MGAEKVIQHVAAALGRGALPEALTARVTAVADGNSIRGYHECMMYFARAGETREAGLVFGAMRRGGMRPTTASFNILIGAYAAARDSATARSLLMRCPSPNARTLAALTNGCSVAELRFYSSLMKKNHGVAPDVTTLTRWLKVCVTATDVAMLFDTAHEGSVTPDAAFYRAVATKYVDLYHWDGIHRVWAHVQRLEADLDEGTLVAVLHAAAQAVRSGALTTAQTAEFVALAEEMHAAADAEWLGAHEVLMTVYRAAGARAKAHRLYEVVTDALGVPATPCLSRLLSEVNGAHPRHAPPPLQLKGPRLRP